MIGTIAHPLSQAHLLKTSATAAGTTVAAYLDALRSVVRPSGKKTLSVDEVNYRVFERWALRIHGPNVALTMDEAVLARVRCEMRGGAFRNHKGKPYSSMAAQVPAGICRLHNRAFAAKHPCVVRPLVSDHAVSRYGYFLSLTPVTQAALAWFESIGIQPGKTGTTHKTLTVASRALGVSEAFWLLRRLGIAGLESVTAEMIGGLIPTTGAEDPAYRRVIRAINGVSAVYRSCVATGQLQYNPTTGVAHNQFTNYQIRDFLPPDELAKIRDLSNIALDSPFHVSDRLTVLLYVDTALRRNELASLTLTQVSKMEGGYTLHLTPMNQKMGNKRSADIPLLYPETNRLMGIYLARIRPETAAKGQNGLMVNRKGRSAKGCALAAACKREGRRLGLRTYYKKHAPSPHDLRRTFAMNNARPLGMNMEANDLADRLRDRVQTVFEHYVVANPLITAQRAQIYRQRAGGVVDEDKAKEIVRTLRSWGLGDGLIGRMERKLATIRSQTGPDSDQAQPASETVAWIEESKAYDILAERWGCRPFWRKFRRYMHEHNALRRADRFGKVSFDAAVVRSLADDFVPADGIKRQAKVDAALYSQAMMSATTIRFGRLILLRKDEAWRLFNFRLDRAADAPVSGTSKTSREYRAKHPRDPGKAGASHAA